MVYTAKHPWYDKPLTVVYKYRMEPLTGVEPVSGVYKTLVLAIELKGHVAQVRGVEPLSLVLETNVFPLHYTHMALGKGLEPLTFRLTAGRSTIELPKNINAYPNWDALKHPSR